MMNFLRLKFFLAGLTLVAAVTACNDDETPTQPENGPRIEIVAADSEVGFLNFTVKVENATQCAYVCLDATKTLPANAVEILTTGTAIDLNRTSVRVPVTEQTTYAVVAAATDGTTSVMSNKLELTPLKNDEGPIDPTEDLVANFTTGQLLYLPNGAVLLNLLESDNTNIEQTQIRIEGLKNNGALQGNSHLLAEGLYKTTSPSYLMDAYGDCDIDNNLPTGSLVKIERGAAGKAVLTITGTLAKSGQKFTGKFAGILEQEIELKDFSLENIVFDQNGSFKWNADKKTIEIPFRSSDKLDVLKQFTLVFRVEDNKLPAGEYPINDSDLSGTVSIAKAHLATSGYVDGSLKPWQLGYKSGTVTVAYNDTTEEYTITVDAADSYDAYYKDNAKMDVVYGGKLTATFTGKISEEQGGNSGSTAWTATHSNTPAVVKYGLTSELEGYENSYIGRIDLWPDSDSDHNIRIFFINRAPDAQAAGFDPTQIEFIPGYSFITLGQDLDDPVFRYVLMEGDLDLTYDKTAQQWTLHFEGFFVSPVGHKVKVISDYTGPMDGFNAL